MTTENQPVDGEFLDRLPEEVLLWQQNGTITAAQARTILGSYSLPVSGLPNPTQGRLISGLSILGAVLVGLGIILFFAANWDGIDRGIKLVAIVAAVLSSYGLGYFLYTVRGYQRVGTAMVLLACFTFGAAVHLVGQIYNIDVNDPDLFLYWFLGVIPMAYVTRPRPIVLLSVLLLLVAVGFRLPNWLDQVFSGEPVVGVTLYLVLGLLIFAVGRLKSEFAVFRPFSDVYQMVGLTTALGALYVLTFRGVFNSYEDGLGVQGRVDSGYWAFTYASGGLTALLLVGAAWSRRLRGDRRLVNYLEVVGAGVLLAAAFIAVRVVVGGDLLYPIVFNTLLGLCLLGLLIAGYLLAQEVLVNLTLGFISLDVITRYFEFSWSLLDRSMVFVAAGVLLLIGGFLLERGRRKVVSAMRPSGGTG